jgi:hypothetical protein
MHDPMTVAFEIRSPFKRTMCDGWSYRPSLITVWHVDPECDGSDDSCGWSAPKLTKEQRSRLDGIAYDEAHSPWYQRDPLKRITSAADAESLLRGAIQIVAMILRVKLKWEEVCELACSLAHHPGDNFQSSLCHLPGWHTNFQEDVVSEREYCAKGFFCQIARVILRHKRPWYKHPRFHFWHWKIQIHALQNFKRWAFSRCEYCGKGFGFGESPCTYSWNNTGPLWFRSEKNIHHSGCSKEGQVEQPVQAGHA